MSVAGIAVLGPLTVEGGVPVGPRDRVVLTALAVHPGEVVSAERLADALWGERPPPSWNKVVPGCVMRLRRALGSEAIETTPHGYRLMVPADEVDAHRFERLVDRGRQLLTLGEPERAGYVLREALGLWRGRALVDLGDWEPGRIEAARLEELRLDAEEARIDACLRVGQHREVLGEAQARVTEAPLRERRWALLALAQYQGGRQSEALRTLHRARTVLATEMGLDPGPDLLALEQAILRQDPALVAEAVRIETSAACPYLGLVPYGVSDSEGFFGRDAEVADCLRRLAANGVLAVVGPSGCGKSSLVRAGVAARLQRAGHRVVVVTPGARPMDALTSLPAHGDAVLVVDQCEEAVSLCDDPAVPTEFFAALVDRAERGPIVLAVRIDRLGDASAHAAFARLVERGLYLLGPMDDANLRAAIEGPAHQGGLLLEPGLVDLLVRDVEGEPGALPLLSHALHRTWERREGRTLTVVGYRETGGIRGAVAQSAEELYERVPPEQRPLLRDLLLRLVVPSPDGEPIRGRVQRRRLATDADHDQLIEQLVAARLVISDDEVVELAHEALARAWPRLRGWLDDDVEGQRILRHLTNAADAWDTMGRPNSELYRGMRLTQALEWRHRTHADLTPTEREFLDGAQRHAEIQSRRQRHSGRRRRALLAGAAALLLVAAVAGMLAVRQRERADSAAIAADARRASALGLTADDVDRSLLLAVEAVRLDDSPDTRANLLAALSRSPALIGSTRADGAFVAVDVSPDGEVVAAADGLAGTAFYDSDTVERLGTHDEPVWRLEYRPDGAQLAAATSTWPHVQGRAFDLVPVLLIDPSTFESEAVQLGGLPDGQVEAWDLDYSADGRFLTVSLDRYEGSAFESTVMVWAVDAPQRPVQRVEPGRVWAVALSPDGSVLYVGTHDPPTLSVYELASGNRVRSIALTDELAFGTTLADDAADGLEISPDGSTLAVLDANDVVLLDATTLAERGRLSGHSGFVSKVEFSHDGTLLASGAGDRTVVVWDLASGAQREQLLGHAGVVKGLTFSPDDATLYSVGLDQRLLVWDLQGERRFMPSTTPFERGSFGAWALLAPDGEAIVHFSTIFRDNEGGSTIRFLDVAAGELGDPIVTEHATWSPTWRLPDAEQVAVAVPGGVVQVWDRRSGELVAERKVTAGNVEATIAYTDDGQRILIGELTGAVFQVDADTLEPVGPRVEVGDGILQVIPVADARLAMVLREDTFASIDLVDGRVLTSGDLGLNALYADASPDGRRLGVGAITGEVGVVDVSSGGWIRPPVAAHTDGVQGVSYATDGATLASSGWDGRVSLWDGRTGALLATVVPGRTDVGTLVEFLADGQTAVITNTDGAVYTWDTRLEHWIDFACAVAGRNLTEDEWREVFGDRPYRQTCPTA